MNTHASDRVRIIAISVLASIAIFALSISFASAQVAPTCTISANPSNIAYSGTSYTPVVVSWNSTNASSANLTNVGSVALSGSQTFYPSSTNTYVLTVYNTEGQSGQCQTTVTVTGTSGAPSCWITLAPQYSGQYQYNQPATLSWDSTNANSANISSIGSAATSGSQTVYPTQNQIYTMTVYNSQGQSATCQTSSYYQPGNLYCTVTANPQTVPPGGTTNLTWTSSGATSAWLSDGIGSVSLSGSRTVYPQSSRNYTLTVNDNQGRTQTCSAYVSVTGTSYYPGPTYPTYPPPVPSTNVSLDQIPYTGFDFGTVGNTLYWFAIALFALGAGYMVVYYFPSRLSFRAPSRAPMTSSEVFAKTENSVEVPAIFRSESQNSDNRN
ncbi:hypothetical protein C4556_00105 [Candidatus Parcubacteria bacterium]|nr:MAG: hypothetical protein C4556_00105 [Candidatus Parcubacteria bacterium]